MAKMARSRRGFLGGGPSFRVGRLGCGRRRAPRGFDPGGPLPLDDDEQEYVAEALTGLEREKIWDTHVHIVGMGHAGTGCWVHPDAMSHWHPLRRLRFEIYLQAAGVSDLARADELYVARLLELFRLANPKGKLLALAFDYAVDASGKETPELSEFHTPNAYVLRLAKEHPEFVPCASVHPYRKDASERLRQVAQDGAVAIKWLPNAMGIDPMEARCDAFYKTLQELSLPLITHAGEEKAVEVSGWQELGNPLRLRRALDLGVRVVVAHCASLGEVDDLDSGPGHRVSAFAAFMRLFTDKRYKETLFADISAMTQFSRSGRPLREILLSKDLHSRLLYGSDYPLPAIDPLVSTRLLERDGYLTAEDREMCNRLYRKNPLLFDLVLKRRLRVEHMNATHAFSPTVFQTADFFAPPILELDAPPPTPAPPAP
mgnify:CR=1 FL=1